MRAVVIIMLLAILLSMGSAMFYLLKRKEPGPKLVRALTIRITLSVCLFIALVLGFHFGLIPQRGL